MLQRIPQLGWIVIIVVVAILLLLAAGHIGIAPDWTGFGDQMICPPSSTSCQFRPAKTLWDVLELFFIPLTLAGVAYLFNVMMEERKSEYTSMERRLEHERMIAERRAQTEQEIAVENLRASAHQAYLDRMTELLLEKRLRESDPNSEVRAVAEVQTLTLLPRLDRERKGSVLHFLYESGLLSTYGAIIPMLGADFSGAILPRVDLSEANLNGINLSGADLQSTLLNSTELVVANLSQANLAMAVLASANLNGSNLKNANLARSALSHADLHQTDLSGAYLVEATLEQAHLINANLQQADLKGASLEKANLSGANLEGANLEQTDLTDANLQQANLKAANLHGARVSNEQLAQARSLEGATMPDGTKHD